MQKEDKKTWTAQVQKSGTELSVSTCNFETFLVFPSLIAKQPALHHCEEEFMPDSTYKIILMQ